MFNNRRQSRDKILIKHILEFIKNENAKIYINNFSKELFLEYLDEYKEQIIVDDNFLEKAFNEKINNSSNSNTNNSNNQNKNYYFVENNSIKKYEDKINNLIIYDWDKAYPKDKYLDIDINKFKLYASKDIVGNSHEKIIEKIYKG